MGKIEYLADLYEHHISAPWMRTSTGSQRVWMVIYDKEDERALRARIGEFEARTIRTGHQWKLVDCTRWFAEWMASQEYRDAYFESPDDLILKLEGDFKPHVIERVRASLQGSDANTVVGILGVASLYGFVRTSELIRAVDSEVAGRLLVFFPGTKDGSNYRLLDARDGWNYLASSISLHSEGARG